ncbi:S41 family peptidase [Candidatus Azobacteroides pseudotrichonymphae]|uniref:Carboxyl-terminal processing protease n=1 Tax=Azobacteroides pseudotrichonymphae genomovar. CFP2 TaxID=511995 RepID=B6YR53_AZOPC|nr:S41 family peptidase [Candidatus Azobacteroides pseudotrichonymphae]BAG83675.1 carboxyl-terminal processing protease [Candidatus Azobacteroides pseudotrichonymphae genomovar. CFP2]
MELKKRVCLVLSLVTGSLIIGIIIGNFISGRSLGRKLFLTPYNKFNVVLDILSKEYVDPIRMKDVTESAILHIINELDPYSIYIPSEELKQFDEDMEGYFGGIGINHLLFKDTVVIVNVIKGSSASQAGLLPGDRIVYINDSIFASNGITEEKVVKALRGGIGTCLKLGICRNSSDQIIEFRVKRKNILSTTVKSFYEIEKGIGFIKICDRFTHSTYNEFMHAIMNLLSLGCKSFIVDLRMNRGGAYDSAIKIVNEFLPGNKVIVYAKGKSFPRMVSVSNGNGILQNSQVVILIDKISASASEIVAGSIQDNDRGLIIGQCSFGKGLIQNQIGLSDGSAIRLTVARYYIPSGRNLHREYELKKLGDQIHSDKSYYGNNAKVDSTFVYHTLHGRSVYGGRGIIPDIFFLSSNASRLSSYYLDLEKKNIFNQFAFEYSDENRSMLNQFKDYSSMLEYLKKQPILEKIVNFASNNGVKKRILLINYSATQILNTAYAWIVSNFLGDDAFYPVYLNNDPVIIQAIEALRKGYAYPEAVETMKYKELIRY